jgi:hypothetical protein
MKMNKSITAYLDILSIFFQNIERITETLAPSP